MVMAIPVGAQRLYLLMSDSRRRSMSDLVPQELEHRLSVWHTLTHENSPDQVEPRRLRQLGAYGGAQGIWVNKKRTSKLTLDGSGVAVGLLHTGMSYPDDLSSDGVLYHYPNTQRGTGRDASEITSTKAAGTLGLPVFVITPSAISSSMRAVHLGWVEDWDDRASVFLISFGEVRHQPVGSDTDHEQAFNLIVRGTQKTAQALVRPGQQRFKFAVMKRYGPACAVCGIGVVAVLDAAHLCPKEKHGCDDPRNGLCLCAVHHRALDAGLFAIHPETNEIWFGSKGPSATDLHITLPSLSHLPKRPHKEALSWCWEEWQRRQA
jgi:hypothetical protein